MRAQQTIRRLISLVATTGLVFSLLTGCGSDETAGDLSAEVPAEDAETPPEDTEAASEDTEAASDDAEIDQLFPDVIGVTASQDGDGSWTFNVTISSPYDSPERYADAWRVVGPDGTVYGERLLLHDHAGEQPFTRSQSGIVIPDGTVDVTVEGRDQVSGWGGGTMTYTLEP